MQLLKSCNKGNPRIRLSHFSIPDGKLITDGFMNEFCLERFYEYSIKACLQWSMCGNPMFWVLLKFPSVPNHESLDFIFAHRSLWDQAPRNQLLFFICSSRNYRTPKVKQTWNGILIVQRSCCLESRMCLSLSPEYTKTELVLCALSCNLQTTDRIVFRPASKTKPTEVYKSISKEYRTHIFCSAFRCENFLVWIFHPNYYQFSARSTKRGFMGRF